MSLSCGIVGLPNAGKSTLFNALASRRLAETAPRPFTTIDPHEAVVPVSDAYLDALWDSIVSLQNDDEKAENIPATVRFIDIAGLIKGAHKGEGLGNKFLSRIREVDVIVHVINAYEDQDIDRLKESYEVIVTELILADLQTLENIDEKDLRTDVQLNKLVKILKDAFNGGKRFNEVDLSKDEEEIAKRYFFLSGKPGLVVINIREGIIGDDILKKLNSSFNDYIVVSAKLAEDLMDLEDEERKLFKKESKEDLEGLDELIVNVYKMLDLITFYTIKGGEEITAWSLKKGKSVVDAAGVVHTDFAEKFIKAEAINVRELLDIGGPARNRPARNCCIAAGGYAQGVAGGWKNAKEAGKIRLEGRDYIVQNGDVIEFKVRS